MFQKLFLILALILPLAAQAGIEEGKALMDKSDCFSCHKVDRKTVGPAYIDVAKKYKGKAGAAKTLVEKVIKGGSGNWGSVPMAGHPNLPPADVEKMVAWVLAQPLGAKASAPAPAPAPTTAVKKEEHKAEAAPAAGEEPKKKKKKKKGHAVPHAAHGQAAALNFSTEEGVKEALRKLDCFGCHSGINRAGGVDDAFVSFDQIQKRGGEKALLVRKVRNSEGALRYGKVPHPRFDHLDESEVSALVGAVLDGTWAKGEAKAKTLDEMTGEEWMRTSSDCFSCHDVKMKKIGPAYADVAKRYAGAGEAQIQTLVKKVKDGGQGNWNLGSAMSDHKSAPDKALEKAVRWILEQK